MSSAQEQARPTFVLVPGAGGSSWTWHRLGAELDRRGLAWLAVDLPAADDDAGLAAYADAVVAAVGERQPLVLVAQSMGGLTAPLVCARLPVRALVLLNAMVPRPGETGGDWWARTGHHEARTRHAAEQGWAADEDPMEVFFHDVPADVRAAAVAAGDPPQSGRPFADPWPLERWPDVPTVVLAGADDRFFPASFQQRVARERLGLEVELLPGGHLLALSRPVELAERLRALAG